MTDLQSQLLHLLQAIDKICRDNDIDYYLTGGTLIGAIRHKGFIPWDDDADIIMTRDNWNRFHKACAETLPGEYRLNSQDDDIELAMTVNHFSSSDTTALFRYNIPNPEQQGLVIDIVIMDPVPDTPEMKKQYIDALTSHTDITCVAYPFCFRVGHDTGYAGSLEEIRSRGKSAVLSEIDKKCFAFSEEESQLYAQRYANAPHFWKKEYYGKPKYVPFETTFLPVPERFGDCLSVGYDDEWMYVPQSGPTRSSHEFCVRSNTFSSETIYNDFEKQIDRESMVRLYETRKALWNRFTGEKVALEDYKASLIAAKTQCKYEKLLKRYDVLDLVSSGDYKTLRVVFEEYLTAQRDNHFVGSSSLSGWINWYRKINPMLIDIGDDALYAACMTCLHDKKLALTGKILKARGRVDRIWSEKMLYIKDCYDDIRQLRSAFECEEYDKCRETMAARQDLYNIFPFFAIYELSIGYRERHSDKESLLRKAEDLLELFPVEEELLSVKAELLLDLGRVGEALEIYDHLSENTTNGLVLFRVKEHLMDLIAASPDKKLDALLLKVRIKIGEISADEMEKSFVEDDESGDDELAEGQSFNCDIEQEVRIEFEDVLTGNTVLRRRIRLLDELDRICSKYHIRYFLTGRTLWQAARYGRFIDGESDIEVMMKPDECRRFMEAVKREKTVFFTDSMLTNPEFKRFSVHFVDPDSLDMVLSSNAATEVAGIYINIEILRGKRNKLKELDKAITESGWERQFNVYSLSKTASVCRNKIRMLCEKNGKAETARKIFLKLSRENSRASIRYHKYYKRKRKEYPAELFEHAGVIELEGKRYHTFEDYRTYLLLKYGQHWQEKEITPKRLPWGRVVDTDIDYQTYFDYLAEKGISIKKFFNKQLEFDMLYKDIPVMNREVLHYWYILEAAGARYEMAEKYYPVRQQLLGLLLSGKIEQLTEELQDYIDKAVFLSRRNVGLYVDKDLHSCLKACLHEIDSDILFENIDRLVKKQKWEPLVLKG